MTILKNTKSLEIRDPNSRGRLSKTPDQKPETRSRPFVIPVFLPHAGCRHQCVFCDQNSITGIKQRSITPQRFQSWVETFLEYNASRRRPVQIAFYGGNFLGQTTEIVQTLLGEATKFVNQGRADSIRISTRPDTIGRRRLESISAFPVSTVELGVQSMADTVLAAARRGHTATDTIKAVKRLRKRNYQIGLQMMVGLPGDDPEKSMETSRQIVNLGPDFVRIYPTIILKGSPLARWYRNRTYLPLALEAAVSLVKNLFLLFKCHGIEIIRMGLQASEDRNKRTSILAGPYHPAFGHMVYSEVFLTAFKFALSESAKGGRHLLIQVAPANISKMRGLKNANVKAIKKEYDFDAVQIRGNPALGSEDLKINSDRIFSIAKNYGSIMNFGANGS